MIIRKLLHTIFGIRKKPRTRKYSKHYDPIESYISFDIYDSRGNCKKLKAIKREIASIILEYRNDVAARACEDLDITHVTLTTIMKNNEKKKK